MRVVHSDGEDQPIEILTSPALLEQLKKEFPENYFKPALVYKEKSHYERIAEHMRSLKFTKGFIQKHWDKYLPQQHEHISQEMAILDMQYEAGFKCLSV